MNIFIIAWNLPEDKKQVALNELRNLKNIYPQLSTETIWHCSVGETAFAASVHTSNQVSAPRRYVWQDKNYVTFYDGCLIDRTGCFAAHDAKALSANWSSLPESLEGQFIVARLNNNFPGIEIMTDFLGMGQAYYYRLKNTWIASNNVYLIRKIANIDEMDIVASSLFLSIGWVGGDYTLHDKIRVIPGGQHWMWNQGNSEPDKSVYYSISKLYDRKKEPLHKKSISRLGESLSNYFSMLSSDFGELICPLTAGRDSRLLAALLRHNNTDAKYYTDGAPNSPDVNIGTEIAKYLGVPHKVFSPDTKNLMKKWEENSVRLIRQNDGMVSLWQIADTLEQPAEIDNLEVKLWGIGGEIARGFYTDANRFYFKNKTEDMRTFLCQKLAKSHPDLFYPQVHNIASRFVKNFFDNTIELGFTSIDALDLFYTYDRVRRWGGSNARKVLSITDLFTPFCTRNFVETAFRIPPRNRYSEPIHFDLITLFMEDLNNIPYEKGAWRSKYPYINTIRVKIENPVKKIRTRVKNKFFRKYQRPPAWDHQLWLETKILWVRELCLDQKQSDLWELIKRPFFEQITSPAVDSSQRRPYIQSLYNIATLFLYDAT